MQNERLNFEGMLCPVHDINIEDIGHQESGEIGAHQKMLQ